MLPDSMREELATQVAEYFGIEDDDLRKAALELQDAGWSWDAMRRPMARIFNVGYDVGYTEGYGDGRDN